MKKNKGHYLGRFRYHISINDNGVPGECMNWCEKIARANGDGSLNPSMSRMMNTLAKHSMNGITKIRKHSCLSHTKEMPCVFGLKISKSCPNKKDNY